MATALPADAVTEADYAEHPLGEATGSCSSHGMVAFSCAGLALGRETYQLAA